MRDAKLRSFDLRSFRIDDNLGRNFDRLIDYPRPALCCDPFCCVGAENQLHLLVNYPGPDAFTCIGTFMRSTLTALSLSMKCQLGTGSAVKRSVKACSITRSTSRCLAVSSVSRFLLSRSVSKASFSMTMTSSGGEPLTQLLDIVRMHDTAAAFCLALGPTTRFQH